MSVITIPSNSSNKKIYSVFTDVIGPINACTTWDAGYIGATSGGYMSNTNVIGKIPVTGIPYWVGPVAGCAFPATNTGGTELRFNPNGFNGTCTFTETVSDSAGNYLVSNTIVYNTVPAGSLVVDAGPDANIVNDYTTVAGATYSGGVGGYSLLWTVDSLPLGAGTPIFLDDTVLAPTISNMTVNGIYTFDLCVTDALSTTVCDQVSITRTGAPTASINWYFDILSGTGWLKIYVNGVLTVNSDNNGIGIYSPSGTIAGVPNGATIIVEVHKRKDTPGLDNTADVYVVSTPVIGGTPTIVDSDTDIIWNAPATANVTFTFSAANNYTVSAEAYDQ